MNFVFELVVYGLVNTIYAELGSLPNHTLTGQA